MSLEIRSKRMKYLQKGRTLTKEIKLKSLEIGLLLRKARGKIKRFQISGRK